MITQHSIRSLLTSIALLLFLSNCADEQPAPEMLRPVRYQEVYSTGGERVRTFTGVARATTESRLSFKVAGTIKRIDCEVGDHVRADKLLAQLDASDYQLQAQQAEASLESSRAQERNAQANYDRVRQLWESRSASRNDLDAARAATESVSAQVKALEKQLELAQSQLSYTRLLAPVDGSIASVDVEINENIRAGQTIVQLSSGAKIEVQVGIPGLLIANLREGQTADVIFDALPGQNFVAHVTAVGVSSEGFATTFPVTVRLDQKEAAIRPGMSAEVSFTFSSSSQVERIIVPPVSVGEDRQGRFVFVVTPGDEEGTASVTRKTVTIGELTDEGLEVFEGLTDGELVVTAGISKLADGYRVKFAR